MEQGAAQQAGALIERETNTAIESMRLVEQVTTPEESAVVYAVDTFDHDYWVVKGNQGMEYYPRTRFASADDVLSVYATTAASQ